MKNQLLINQSNAMLPKWVTLFKIIIVNNKMRIPIWVFGVQNFPHAICHVPAFFYDDELIFRR